MPQNSIPAAQAVKAQQLRFGAPRPPATEVQVAVEAPINIVYGNMPYAVMMATPQDLEDFVAGFSLTEGIVQSVDEIRGIEVEPKEEGVVVTVDLAPGRFREHLARRRNLSGRTSCGLCGVETIEDLPMAGAMCRQAAAISAEAIEAALTALEDQQPLSQLTKATHAAVWCDRSGAILTVREDVGRHNALDKLIGARLRAGADASEGFVLVTSRASFEMIEKAAIFGTGTLVSISGPTSLSIARAAALGLCLVSTARNGGCTVFTGALAAEPTPATA